MYLRPKFQSDSPTHASSADIHRPALSSFQSSNMPCSSSGRASAAGPGPELGPLLLPQLVAIVAASVRSPPLSNSTSAELTVPVHSVGGHGGNVVLILLNSNGGGVSFLVFVGTKQNGAKAGDIAWKLATGSELTVEFTALLPVGVCVTSFLSINKGLFPELEQGPFV